MEARVVAPGRAIALKQRRTAHGGARENFVEQCGHGPQVINDDNSSPHIGGQMP